MGQSSKIDLQKFVVTTLLGGTSAATTANYGTIFVAPFACQLIKAVEYHTNASSASTLKVVKFQSGTAVVNTIGGASSYGLLTSFSLAATANIMLNGTLTSTAGIVIAEGELVGLIPSATPTSAVGVHVSLTFKRA